MAPPLGSDALLEIFGIVNAPRMRGRGTIIVTGYLRRPEFVGKVVLLLVSEAGCETEFMISVRRELVSAVHIRFSLPFFSVNCSC